MIPPLPLALPTSETETAETFWKNHCAVCPDVTLLPTCPMGLAGTKRVRTDPTRLFSRFKMRDPSPPTAGMQVTACWYMQGCVIKKNPAIRPLKGVGFQRSSTRPKPLPPATVQGAAAGQATDVTSGTGLSRVTAPRPAPLCRQAHGRLALVSPGPRSQV